MVKNLHFERHDVVLGLQLVENGKQLANIGSVLRLINKIERKFQINRNPGCMKRNAHTTSQHAKLSYQIKFKIYE